MLVPMDSTKLKAWQARLMYTTLRPALGYLHRMRERMDRRGFPPNDKLLKLTVAAYNAIHSLPVELHYMSCASGVGPCLRVLRDYFDTKIAGWWYWGMACWIGAGLSAIRK